MTRVIIAAAGGPDSKWGNHLGVPKHLVPCDGRPLLARTIAQAHTITGDVRLTCPPDDRRYRLDGATVHTAGPAPSEYASTRRWWNPDGRTVLLLGDVYFTDEAIAIISAHTTHQFRVFGRSGPSKVTGTPYGEIFAASWGPGQHARLDGLLTVVHHLRETGAVTRPPGWMLLRLMQGTPVRQHRVRPPWFVSIDDATDDVDKPVDYARHPAMGGAKQPG